MADAATITTTEGVNDAEFEPQDTHRRGPVRRHHGACDSHRACLRGRTRGGHHHLEHDLPGQDQPNFGDFTATGPAVTAGLICSSGDVFDIRYVFGGFQSDRGVQIQVVKAFVCDVTGDTIYIKLQVHVNPDGTESFTWVVLDGTGPYAKLAGSGPGATINQTPGGNTNIYSGFLLH